jgi:SAM-dependent methyltransferase
MDADHSPSRILDVGGWFLPFEEATHVVDLMPYETRRARLSLEPCPGEKFSRGTWVQIDFLNQDLRLPYDDGFFDSVYCGHTLEDLTDPVPLLRELARVARAGRVVSPSRLSEQTLGSRDRSSTQPGHPHHHWIIDAGPAGLEFCRKSASTAARDSLIPLMVYERHCRTHPKCRSIDWDWQGPLRWQICDDATASRRALQAARSLDFGLRERLHDSTWRSLRRLRNRFFRGPADNPTQWWQQMLELSRPYSLLPL